MTVELDVKKQWIRNVRRVKSPNCDARPDNADISLVVIHGISLPPGHYGGHFIDQLFTNSLAPDQHPYFRDIVHLKVSSHLLINRAGALTQYVPFNKRAWHAGESAFDGCSGCNDFSIGIELEGCDDEPYETIQYQKLADVVKKLMAEWPQINRNRIAGHCDISPGRKTDPGSAFDWEYFFNLLD
ncbi:MAG: 1,6-anhydro-N-acetylmuramyl-L-alanine amidase AmpD [Gammaproteobacteria bacterium]